MVGSLPDTVGEVIDVVCLDKEKWCDVFVEIFLTVLEVVQYALYRAVLVIRRHWSEADVLKADGSVKWRVENGQVFYGCL